MLIRLEFMQCFIYKSLKREELYLYLANLDDFSCVPDALLQSFGRLAFVMELQLTPERKLARENAVKVMNSIQSKGFFIQLPPTLISDSQRPTNLQQLH
jgi:uncharacterized protein